MHPPAEPYTLFPLGDSALTIQFGNGISESINREVMERFRQLQQSDLPGIREWVPAYCSITVYYDIMALRKFPGTGQTVQHWVAQQLRDILDKKAAAGITEERIVKIPVCYDPEYAPDLSFFSRENNCSHEELIALHTGRTYMVYMLGFLPGFPYMGEVADRLVAPRKPQPVNIKAGSVGIAGRQTGIYPLDSPGGWQVIGRTPLRLFDKEKEEPALLRPGDRVRFYAISKEEFREKEAME